MGVLTRDDAIHYCDDACLSLRGLAGDPAAARRIKQVRNSHEALRAEVAALREERDEARTAYVAMTCERDAARRAHVEAETVLRDVAGLLALSALRHDAETPEVGRAVELLRETAGAHGLETLPAGARGEGGVT